MLSLPRVGGQGAPPASSSQGSLPLWDDLSQWRDLECLGSLVSQMHPGGGLSLAKILSGVPTTLMRRLHPNIPYFCPLFLLTAATLLGAGLYGFLPRRPRVRNLLILHKFFK